MRLIDVKHLGREKVIGAWHVDDVIVDPGPASSVETVVEALGGEPPRALLLTHIHLDHAGAAGTLVRRWPELEVYVHERGAPHLADPTRLLASAGQIYGEQMDHLWAEVLPVPEANLRPLAGGETVLGFEVAYTPGHASHHVCYLHSATGRAFVGDMAAVVIPPSDFVIPPTPPPDIDIELWSESLDTILDWTPESLGITHFGVVEDPAAHMEVVRERLAEQAERARDLSPEEFARRNREDAESAADPTTAASLLQAVPPEQGWSGLDRYWSKRAAA